MILSVLSLSISALLAADTSSGQKLSLEECVAIAIKDSAKVAESEAKVDEYKARLAQVESIYYPKLWGMGIIAPMFSVDFADISSTESVRRWKSINDWGPYMQLEATLAQPLYTFGRAQAGEDAARARMEVEKARLRESRNAVALEVRKLYYTHLYSLSLLPTLRNAQKIIKEAQQRADELYAKGGGEVTQVDLNKLEYGRTEIDKYLVRAEKGEFMALAALKHTMGWPAERELSIAETRLPRRIVEKELSVAKLMTEASQNRPEWAQIEQGKRAALRLADAEMLANAPVLFLAGKFTGSWTPTRDNTSNPYHNDPYNRLSGGIALGMKFDIDYWAASARSDIALAQHKQVEALERFADTGIPMQVRMAYDEMLQSRQLAELSKKGVKATNRWMTFATSAFGTGTGEAKDVLEGLAAYVTARNGHYESLRDFFVARSKLDYALGRALRPTN